MALIKRFDVEYQPTQNVINDLKLILTVRNDLAHRIAEAIERSLVDKNWDRILVPELDAASTLFEMHMPTMLEYMSTAYSDVGLHEKSIDAELKSRFPWVSIDAQPLF